MVASSDRSRLIVSSFAIAALTVLARLLGGVLQIVLAARFGASAQLDAYFVAVSLPTLISDWFIVAAPSVALVPLLTGLHRDGERDSAWELVCSFGNALFIVVCAMTLTAFLAGRPLVGLIAPGLDATARDLTASLFRWASLMLLPALGSGVLRAVLHARERFLAPVLAVGAATAGTIAAVLVLGDRLGVGSIVVGLLVGGLLGLLVNGVAARGLLLPWRAVIDLRGAVARRSGALLGAFLLIGTAAQVNSLTDRFFASLLAVGSISVFQYAEKLASFFMLAFAGAVAVPAYTAFSKDVAARDMGELRARVAGSTRLVAFVTLPLLALCVVMREPIVRLLLQHGAMSARDADAIALVFGLLCVAWAIYAFAQVLTFAYFSLQETRGLVLLVIAGIVVNIALDAVLLRPLGVPGLAIATAVSTAASNAVLWWLLMRRLASNAPARAGGAYGYALRMIAAALGAGLAAWAAGLALEGWSAGTLAARAAAVALPAAAALVVYLGACRLLRIREAAHIREALFTSRRRAPMPVGDGTEGRPRA